jgi:hypothetical protein
VWLPVFGIRDPISTYEKVPFQPWAKALYDYRQVNELEPHTRCKASGTARQFLTPYGVEFVELPELQRIYIFDIGGPHTYRTIYMDGRSHPGQGQRLLLRSFDRLVGGRHAGGRHDGLQRELLARSPGLPHTAAMHTIERSRARTPRRSTTRSPSTIRARIRLHGSAVSISAGKQEPSSSNTSVSRRTTQPS